MGHGTSRCLARSSADARLDRRRSTSETGTVKLRLAAVFDAQYGGVRDGLEPSILGVNRRAFRQLDHAVDGSLGFSLRNAPERPYDIEVDLAGIWGDPDSVIAAVGDALAAADSTRETSSRQHGRRWTTTTNC